MESPKANSNLYRRRGPAILLALAWPALKLMAWLLAPRGRSRPGGLDDRGGRNDRGGRRDLVVYQCYQVGDFYMALPAILSLARHMSVTVICRPDCVFALEGTGVKAVGFEAPFFTRPTLPAFLTSFRNALALRGSLSGEAMDFEADPRTALLLKAAGLDPVVSYARAYAWLFDRVLPLDPAIRHQSLKNDALAAALLAERGMSPATPRTSASERPAPEDKSSARPAPAPEDKSSVKPAPGGILLSCWTRKDTKNWPFRHWDAFLTYLVAQGRPLTLIVPPDADAGFREFRSRWEGRVDFLSGSLPRIAEAVAESGGVIATDNFLGHMAAFLGKRVLWINGSSEAAHVAPRGDSTTVVQLDPMPCRPCRHRCVNPIHKQCLEELRPEAVIAAAAAWLSRPGWAELS